MGPGLAAGGLFQFADTRQSSGSLSLTREHSMPGGGPEPYIWTLTFAKVLLTLKIWNIGACISPGLMALSVFIPVIVSKVLQFRSRALLWSTHGTELQLRAQEHSDAARLGGYQSDTGVE